MREAGAGGTLESDTLGMSSVVYVFAGFASRAFPAPIATTKMSSEEAGGGRVATAEFDCCGSHFLLYSEASPSVPGYVVARSFYRTLAIRLVYVRDISTVNVPVRQRF